MKISIFLTLSTVAKLKYGTNPTNPNLDTLNQQQFPISKRQSRFYSPLLEPSYTINQDSPLVDSRHLSINFKDAVSRCLKTFAIRILIFCKITLKSRPEELLSRDLWYQQRHLIGQVITHHLLTYYICHLSFWAWHLPHVNIYSTWAWCV